MGKSKLTTLRIVRIAIFSALIFVQEELLSFIPNVQLTQCLITIFFYSFGILDTSIIVILHTLLDNVFIGSLNLIYTPSMLVGWLSLVLILTLFRKNENKYVISIVTGLHGIIYSLCFAISTCLVQDMNFFAYISVDIPFTIILVVNGFVTTLILFKPLTKVLRSLDPINKKE